MKLTSLIAAAVLMIGTVAQAATQLSVNVGQRKVVAISQKVSKVTVSDQGIVEVRQQGSGSVSLVGKGSGKAHVQLRTVDGVEVDLVVHVTEGGDIYQVGR